MKQNNPLLNNVRGSIGDLNLRNWQGKTIVGKKPGMRKSHSPKQLAQINRFKAAREYTREQLATEEGLAEYKSGITRRKHTAFLVAMSDYLNKPKITKLDISDYSGRVGDDVFINAHDDFKVVRVTVAIFTPDNVEIERGDAHPYKEGSSIWLYKGQASVADAKGCVVRATAYDRPKNEGTAEAVVTRVKLKK